VKIGVNLIYPWQFYFDNPKHVTTGLILFIPSILSFLLTADTLVDQEHTPCPTPFKKRRGGGGEGKKRINK
jgi:hypothetical protein